MARGEKKPNKNSGKGQPEPGYEKQLRFQVPGLSKALKDLNAQSKCTAALDRALLTYDQTPKTKVEPPAVAPTPVQAPQDPRGWFRKADEKTTPYAKRLHTLMQDAKLVKPWSFKTLRRRLYGGR